jgi:hypothetical protein
MQNSLMNPVLNGSENFPIYDPDYLWGTTVYEKGGCVLHMLRGVVGDAVFFDALGQYRAAYEHGNAVTPQFQATVEGAYGQDLDWFFQEWIYDVGWPEYRYAWIGQPDGGSYRLLLAIDQTQTNGPIFAMPLEVKVTTTTGDVYLDLWIDEAHEYFDLPLAASPTAVTLDPYNWILNRATEVASSSVEDLSIQDPVLAGGGAVGVRGADLGPLTVVPNPFAGAGAARSVAIGATLARAGRVRAEIFDPAGRLVRVLIDEARPAGSFEVRWDGRNARGGTQGVGVYLVRVSAGGARTTETLRLIR